ncbi:Asp-tRNA(Asn)/Glu-tRNA(Gln) amidotransferase subunit GatB, partial [Methanothrix sp.]
MGDVIIGLEIHVQLNRLESKMFCGCSTKYHNSPPNTHTCPVCLGLPGSLPVINRKAVESGIKVGLALNCHIEEETLFYRKNYYYPDLSKGFQISQYDYPLATNGHIMILGDDGIERNIRINRAHMEEDPGRLVHAGTIDRAKYTMVDYNRCGMSLLEVVTEPDLRSPKEARAFLDKLKSILEYLDVFDGSLEGAMRVDANISLRGGDRSEVKNISGFKGVEKALSYEITRQRNLARRNIKVVQETRHFDELRNITVSIRSKVGAHDYRYFPEADLVAMRIASWVPAIRDSLPELPDSKRERFVRQYGLTDDHAKSLTTEIKVADFYELVAARTAPKMAAVWIADVLKGELNYRNLGIESFDPEHMVQIVQLLEGDEITEHSAVAV